MLISIELLLPLSLLPRNGTGNLHPHTIKIMRVKRNIMKNMPFRIFFFRNIINKKEDNLHYRWKCICYWKILWWSKQNKLCRLKKVLGNQDCASFTGCLYRKVIWESNPITYRASHRNIIMSTWSVEISDWMSQRLGEKFAENYQATGERLGIQLYSDQSWIWPELCGSTCSEKPIHENIAIFEFLFAVGFFFGVSIPQLQN